MRNKAWGIGMGNRFFREEIIGVWEKNVWKNTMEVLWPLRAIGSEINTILQYLKCLWRLQQYSTHSHEVCEKSFSTNA